MPFVKMPKDLSKIKTKMAFNLTKRQLISFGLAAGVGFPIFFLTKGTIGVQGAGFCTFIAACPFFLAGLYERNGQPFEKVFKHVLNLFFIRPKKRPYKTVNYYNLLVRQADLERECREIEKE